MAYNPDEEPTQQIHSTPESPPDQRANEPASGLPPQQAAHLPEAERYMPMPSGSYLPPQPESYYSPAASYYSQPPPNYPLPDQASYPPAPPGAYQTQQPIYPPPISAPPTRQARGNSYPPSTPGAGDTAGARPAFNARQFWREMGLLGQVSGSAGLLMLIFFFLPWLYTPNFTANISGRAAIPTVTRSGWHTAAGVQLFSNVPPLNLFPHLWLVLLGALALIALGVMLGLHRISIRAAAWLLSLIALGALLLEFFFLIQVSSLGSAIRIGLSSALNQTPYGTSWGFWLTVVATIAALGVGIYMLLEAFAPDTFRRPRTPGTTGGPHQQPTPTA